MLPLSDEITRDFRQKMAQQAQLARLLKQPDSQKRMLPGRLLMITGDTLISLGLWLKNVPKSPSEEFVSPLYT
jgi:hypothetical protein